MTQEGSSGAPTSRGSNEECPSLAALRGAGGLNRELSPALIGWALDCSFALVFAYVSSLIWGWGGRTAPKPCLRTLKNCSGMHMSSCDWILVECVKGPS